MGPDLCPSPGLCIEHSWVFPGYALSSHNEDWKKVLVGGLRVLGAGSGMPQVNWWLTLPRH